MNPVARVMARINSGETPDHMSTGEQIAAALICNRMDWLPPDYEHPLDAIDRLGSNWFRMVMEYHRDHQ